MNKTKFTCICLTYDRPELLSRVLYSYLEQDYPDDLSELIILDDAGQYKSQSNNDGKPWELISVSRRFSSVGAKRNAIISMASRDSDAIVIWDDDDVYLPWTLKAHAAALSNSDWSRPSMIVDDRIDRICLCEPCGASPFHASWAYRMDIFKTVGGYSDMISGEDKDLAGRFINGDVKCGDPIKLGFDPYFVFNRNGSSYHISYMPRKEYYNLKARDIFIDKLEPSQWDSDYISISKKLIAEKRDSEPDRSSELYRKMELF